MKKTGWLLLCCAFFCGGCAADRVETLKHTPEKEVSYQARADVRCAMQKVDRGFELALSQLLGNDSPGGRAGKKAFLKRYCIWKLSGIGDLQQIEESSVRISAEPPQFDNCREWRFAANGKGILPGIFGAPRKLQTELFPVPYRNTMLCGAAVIRVKRIADAVQANFPPELLPREVSSLIPLLAKVPETQLFFRLSRHQPKNDSKRKRTAPHLCWEFRTAAPAPELFAALRQWAAKSGCGIIADDKIFFGLTTRSWVLEQDAQGRLMLHDGHAAPAAEKMQNELTRVFCSAPESSLLLYLAPGALSDWEMDFFSRMRLGRLPFTAELLGSGGVFSLAAAPNQLRFTDRTDLDLFGARLFREALLPMIAGELLMGQEIYHESFLLRQQEDRKNCCEALRHAYPLLKQYADAHAGRFPERSGAEGLKALFPAGQHDAIFRCPCGTTPKETTRMAEEEAPYLYFGGFKTSDNPDFPLLLDLPGRHPVFFNVLLRDGRVLTIDLEPPVQLRRMIGALQSRFRYSEKDLALLLKKAEELESLLPQEQESAAEEEDDDPEEEDEEEEETEEEE